MLARYFGTVYLFVCCTAANSVDRLCSRREPQAAPEARRRSVSASEVIGLLAIANSRIAHHGAALAAEPRGATAKKCEWCVANV